MDHGLVFIWPEMATHATHFYMTPKAARPKNVTSVAVSSTDCVPSSWPGEIAEITYTNMTSSGITDHSGPSGKSSPQSESFLILNFCHWPEPGESQAMQCIQGMNLHLHKLQAAAEHPADPIGQ